MLFYTVKFQNSVPAYNWTWHKVSNSNSEEQMNNLIRFCILCSIILHPLYSQSTRKVELIDIMKFKQMKETVLSDSGKYIAIGDAPDRGNKELLIYDKSGKLLLTIPRGESAQFSTNEKWVVATIAQDYFEKEKKPKDTYQPSILAINLSKPDTIKINDVDKYFISPDGEKICVLRKIPEKTDSSSTKPKPAKDAAKESAVELKQLIAIHLQTKDSLVVQNVIDYSIDSLSSKIYYSVYDTVAGLGGLFSRKIGTKFESVEVVDSLESPYITTICTDKTGRVAYIRAKLNSAKKTVNGELVFIDNGLMIRVKQDRFPIGWQIPSKNKLTYSKDAHRLFFGITPLEKEPIKISDTTTNANYNIDLIQSKREIDLWHWDDPLIKTQEKFQFKQTKEKLYFQAGDLELKRIINLTDSLVGEVTIKNNPQYLLTYTNLPYRKEVTWDDYYYDAYCFNLRDNSKKMLVRHIQELPQISPIGSFGVFFQGGQWKLFDCNTVEVFDVTAKPGVSFANEDNDVPALPSSYGIGGWVSDTGVLVYDKYDIWSFSSFRTAWNLTKGEGRKNKTTFRVIKTDTKQDYFEPSETILLTATSEIDKSTNIYSLSLSTGQLKQLTKDQLKYSFKQKAKNADVVAFVKESYRNYPDILLSDKTFADQKRVSNFGAQVDSFAWGKAELFHWKSREGNSLDGILIKPADYAPGKAFPLIVYFYELFSQRLFDFPDMVLGHRPNFAYYTSHGYGILMPDVRYKVGEPGMSAINCIVPGVQRLIDSGLVRAKSVGLIGHSWSGYQTAYMISQTNIFSAAIAGAPVGNMTSAYSGIRTESGMARQFQYEKAQSRIGGSLWEKLDNYIANSPVFQADKIKTPLLIEHGDEDEAVPFSQGVEMYMAMRRLGKVCYFLQYRGEPHHPKKYPNKLDYTLKQIDFFNHYLQGTPIADWMNQPTPYMETK